MQHSEVSQSVAEIFSLATLVRFWAKGKLLILGGCALGIAIALIFLVSINPVYEASATLEMGEIRSFDTDNLPTSRSVEQPTQVIERFNNPAAFTPELLSACGVAINDDAARMMSDAFRLTFPNAGSPNTLSVKVKVPSPEVGDACVTSFYNLLVKQQALISAPVRKGLEELRSKLSNRLQVSQNEKVEGISADVGIIRYLMTHEDISYINKTIDRLDYVTSSYAPPRISAIFSPSQSVFPRVTPVIVLGLLLGLLLGGIAACLRMAFKKP